MANLKDRYYDHAIDILRIIAIVCVIIIHTTTRILEASHYDLMHAPWAFFLNQIFRFAVPLFFFISGFTLTLNYSYHTSYFTFIKKRCSKIFLPYIFWSFIYFLFVYTQHTSGVFSYEFLDNLLIGNASYQLYFIPSLLIFYFIFPIFYYLYPILKQKIIVVCLFILEIILLTSDYYMEPLPFYLPIRIAMLNFFLFFLGMIFSHHREKIVTIVKKIKLIIMFCTLFMGGIVVFEAYSNYIQTGNYLYFYSQWRPSILLYSIGIISLLYACFKNAKPVRLVHILSSLSFFVFFFHIIVLEILWHTLFQTLYNNTQGHIAASVSFNLFYSLLVVFFSYGVAVVVSKIPKLYKILG